MTTPALPRPAAAPSPALQAVLIAVAESTASAVIVTDADDRIVWVNASFTRITGWSAGEVLGQVPRELLNGPDTEDTAIWHEAHRQRRGGEPVDGIELKLYRKDRQPYWALVELRPMHDASGRITHHLHLHTDVTARVAAERRAQESQRWLQLASSVFGLGLWHLSLPDGVMVWDGTLKQMLGLPREALTPSLAELLDRFVLSEDRTRFARALRTVPPAGAHAEIEVRIRQIDGELRTVVSRYACVDHHSDGTPRRILGAVLDVTETRATTLQLRDALRRLRLAAEASGIGAWERDLVTGEGSWDPTMFTLLGRLPAERAPSREDTLLMVHPDDRAAVVEAWRRMSEEIRPVEYEYRIVKPDGSIVHMVTRGMVERDRDGHPVRALGTVIDVTAQRQAERERDELTRRIELVADSIGLGIWEWDPDRRVSRWNDRMYALYGHTRESFQDRVWTDCVHPDDLAMVQQAFDAACADGTAFDVEFRVQHEGGTWRWIASRGRGETDADGRVQRVLGVNWDIDDRVRMERNAVEAERAARDLLQRMLLTTSATGIGVWERDLVADRLIWDRQMYRLFGREPDHGPPPVLWQTAVHPEDREHIELLLAQTIAGGPAFEAEFRVLLPDGSLRWLAGRGLLRDDGDGRSLLGINWDITERRLAENALRAKETAERANAAKTEFLSRMSHELRTPLNAILGFTQLLELDGSRPLADEQRERVEHIRQAGWHLLALINEVLDLSRIEAGKARIELASVPLADVLDECLTLIDADARRRRLQVAVRRLPGAPATLLADRTRLKQVLLNLLSNAVKYNRDGGRIDVVVSADSPGWGMVTVRDTGDGITAQKMDVLFQPFNRLGLETAPIEGTGIGLTIALKLAEQMGGRLEASSEPGIGSAFTLTLRARADAAEPAGTGAPPAPPVPPAPVSAVPGTRSDVSGSVLCVEDNETNVQLVQQLMRLRPNVTLFVARDGGEARLMAPVCQPDLLVLDLRLPDIPGLALLAELRAQPTLANMPCLAVSANALDADIAAARAAGVDDYLTKPLDAAVFLTTVDRMLRAPPPE